MCEPMQIEKSIDDTAQQFEYRLIDAVSAVQTWLVAMRAATGTARRREAADHVVQSLAQIEELAAHAGSLLKRVEHERSEE